MRAVAGALVMVLTISACGSASGGASHQLPTSQSASSVAPTVAPSSSAETTQPGNSTSVSSTASKAPAIQVVPPVSAARDRSFSIVIHTKQKGDIPSKSDGGPEKVYPKVVPVGNPAVPGEPPGSDWKNTSIWVAGSTYPSLPAVGRSQVDGHSCHHHDRCPFSAIQQHPDGSFTVQKGDTVTVSTPNGVLTYQVCGIGLSSKARSQAVVPSCGSTPVDLVVVTCHFETGDESDYNIVIATTLIGGVKH